MLLLLLPQVAVSATVTEVHYVMGTYFRITAEQRDPGAARTAMRLCFTSARDLESRFSRFDPSSELSQLNATDVRAVTVSDDMAALLRRSLQLRQTTGGSFDVAVGSLTTLWRKATQWPTAAQLAAARAGLGDDALQLQSRTLIRQPGVRIDLDGVAKGFAVDRCAAQLRAAGITPALLSFGESSLYAIGAPAGTHGWTVTVRSIDTNHALGTLTLRDRAASISAVFGHERQIGPRRVGHIVNPHTGEPLTAPALAVVVASSATDAEAFSKAVLVEASLVDKRTLTLRRAANEPAGKTPLWSPLGKGGRQTLPLSKGGWQTLPPYQGGIEGGFRRRNVFVHGLISGALLIRPGSIRRIGTIPFTALPHPTRIAAAAEPLR